jgi:hypothetical protein
MKTQDPVVLLIVERLEMLLELGAFVIEIPETTFIQNTLYILLVPLVLMVQ